MPVKIIISEEKLLDDPVIKYLISLQLPPEDFVIVGSASMYLYGLRKFKDIDIVARGKAWEKAKTLGKVEITVRGNPVIRLFDNKIEIFTEWGPGFWDVDKLIEEAVSVAGIKFMRLEDVLVYKQRMQRPKDHADILAIEKLLAENH